MSAQFTYEMCTTELSKNTKNPYFESTRSFKFIDADTVRKLVTDRQTDGQTLDDG